jgi:hypothetical protein
MCAIQRIARSHAGQYFDFSFSDEFRTFTILTRNRRLVECILGTRYRAGLQLASALRKGAPVQFDGEQAGVKRAISKKH